MLELGNELAAQNVTIGSSSVDLSGGTFPTTCTARGTLRISVCLDTATTVSIRFTPTGGSAFNMALFDGAAMVANAGRTCIVKLPEGTTFTVRFGAACLVQFMTIEQVVGGAF